MKILRNIGVTLLTTSLLTGGFIFYTKTTQAQELLPAYQYEIVNQSPDATLTAGQTGFLTVTIRNIGSDAWLTNQIYLNSIYLDGTPNRVSSFATSIWASTGKITPDATERELIKPNGTISFSLPIEAPERPALYQEMFKPYLGEFPIAGANIKWLIQVGDQLNYQTVGGKQIRIWLADQRIWAMENGVVVLDTPISSGKAGYNTPKGNYKILNHIPTAYSSKYSLFMDNWMALYTKERGFLGYGLHALPYWTTRQSKYASGTIVDGRLYKDNKVYEDINHLGKVMSHGCVRLGIEASKVLYDWTPNNTPVVIA